MIRRHEPSSSWPEKAEGQFHLREEDAMSLVKARQQFPEKFAPENKIFDRVHRGDRIFIGTGCGEPQALVQALVDF